VAALAGLKSRTRGHSHNCGVEMYIKGNFLLYMEGSRGAKTSTHFLKMMQNVLKLQQKFQKKWVRNIHAKNSEVLQCTPRAWDTLGHDIVDTIIILSQF
jgi:hypothetical protein